MVLPVRPDPTTMKSAVTTTANMSFPTEDHERRAHEDDGVQPQSAPRDVFEVVFNHELRARVVLAVANLPEAGDPRPHQSPDLGKLREVLQHERCQRPGPDEAHLAAQDVEQLRQLVDAGPAEERPDWRHAQVTLDLMKDAAVGRRQRPRVVARRHALIGDHRPELETPEPPAAIANSFVRIERRPCRRELDEESNDDEYGREDGDEDCRDEDVKPAFQDGVSGCRPTSLRDDALRACQPRDIGCCEH